MIVVEFLAYILLCLISLGLITVWGVQSEFLAVVLVMSLINLFSWNRTSIIPYHRVVFVVCVAAALYFSSICQSVKSDALPMITSGFVLVVFLTTVTTDIMGMISRKTAQ